MITILNIEYGADFLLGVQFAGMDFQINTKGKWETDSERKYRVVKLIAEQKKRSAQGLAQNIEIKVMKNRRYETGSTSFYLYPKYNLLSDVDYDSEQAEKNQEKEEIDDLDELLENF